MDAAYRFLPSDMKSLCLHRISVPRFGVGPYPILSMGEA